MIFSPFLLITLICIVRGSKQYEENRLDDILDSLTRILQYMKNQSHEINLDGVVGTRFVQEQLQAYLEYEADVFENIRPEIERLIDLAMTVADEAEVYVKENEKAYSSRMGNLMDRSKRLLWHPSTETNPDDIEQPFPCSQYIFNGSLSNSCLINSVGSKNIESCHITEECVRLNTAPKQKGYVITHQVLYWQLLEKGNCIEQVSPSLKVYLCSNVMRDANEIETAYYPLKHRDLFLEQIAFCGMWGFKDFYKFHWLDEILEWQYPSGCFANRAKWHCEDNLVPDIKTRVKRCEKVLENGCLSHKTAMASIAMTVYLRFEAERLYYSNF